MDWTEVNIYTSSEGVDPVCGCLLGVGITGFAIKDSKDFEEFLERKDGNWDYVDDDLMEMRGCETCVTVYLPGDSQGADMLASVRREMAALKERDAENRFGRLVCELANVREEDWANNWKQYFKPFEVGSRLVVKPSWEDYDNPNGRTVLEIDPASSFGTGQHHTTRLCLELIEKNIRSGDRLLDLGCGSGILSIAALLLGAKEVTAVDISLNSVETAKENAAKNHISAEKYTAYCGDIIGDTALAEKIGGGFDMIAANIVADVLIAMSPLFGKFLKKGGILILSGIITERADEVIDKVRSDGYTLVETREKDGWAALQFTVES